MEVALEKKKQLLRSGGTFDAAQVRRELERRSDFSFVGRHHLDLVLSVRNGQSAMSRWRAPWLNYPAPQAVEHRQVTAAELSGLYAALLREDDSEDESEGDDELMDDEENWETFDFDELEEGKREAIAVCSQDEDYPAHLRRIDFAKYERPHYVSVGAL